MPTSRSFTWPELEAMARSLPLKTNLVVPRANVPAPPPYEPSRLGRRRGAQLQYRCDRRHRNLHVKEYEDRWVLHVDRWNPHRHPIRHLFVDHGYKFFVHVFHLLGSAPATPATADE